MIDRQERAALLGHRVAGPAAARAVDAEPRVAVRQEGGAAGAALLQRRLKWGWTWSGRAESAELERLFTEAGNQVRASRLLFDQLDPGWVGLFGGRKGDQRRAVERLERILQAEDDETVQWAEVANRRASLTALRAEADGVLEKLNRQRIRQSAGVTDVNYAAVEARNFAAFRAYAPALTANLFGTSVAHFGSAENFADVLDAAHTAGAPVPFMTAFLTTCQARNWQALARVQGFFEELQGSAAADFSPALGWAVDFTLAANTGVGGASKPNFPGGGGGNAPVVGGPYPFNFNTSWYAQHWQGLPRRDTNVIVAQGDLGHWKCGHTFEEFKLTRANARRAPTSSLWPRGTLDAAIIADAGAAAGALDAQIRAQILANPLRFELDTAVGAYTYHLGINNVSGGANNLYRMVQLFPTAGAQSVPREALCAIIRLFGG